MATTHPIASQNEYSAYCVGGPDGNVNILASSNLNIARIVVVATKYAEQMSD
jgi:hypothetical protein